MNPLAKRLLSYGAATALTGGMIYAGFVYQADPDLLTMVSSVDVQLRMASVMPEREKDGTLVQERADLLKSARTFLDRIERVEPDYPPAYEYRAFLAYLEKDYAGAAGHYATLRGLEGCSDELREHSVVNQVKMLKMAGDDAGAQKVAQAHEASLSAENASAVQAAMRHDRDAEAAPEAPAEPAAAAPGH
ncbi:MAG: hypothetical protein AAF628_31655 [Planctomycetota bacterium]